MALLACAVAGCDVSDPVTVGPQSGSSGDGLQSSGQGTVPDAGRPGIRDDAPSDSPAADTDTGPADVFPPSDSDLAIVRSVYVQDGYDVLDVERLDVRTVTQAGVCVPGDESGCTLADVLADTDPRDDFKVDIPIHFRSARLPDDGQASNAELRQRGGGTRLAPQKSFRIRFDDADTTWRGERRVLLNKHPFESSRIRNKAAMDMLAQVPHMTSLRTQFVNLWIDDGVGAVDQGLYTQVEGPGGRFLERRGFSDDDRLYKAQDFRFSSADLNVIGVDEEGRPDSEALFNDSIEIEHGEDHRALFRMMSALQDPQRSFSSVLDAHFNRNNVLVWLASNLLMHQKDAVQHNFILHNPAGTERFYFVPWDYDLTWGTEAEPVNSLATEALEQRLNYGYAANAKNEFVSRFYREPGTHARMIEVAQYLRDAHFTDANLSDRIAAYAALAAPFQERSPDARHNPEYYQFASASWPEKLANNLEALKTSFAVPLPPVLQPPTGSRDALVFRFEPGFDVTGGALSHDILVATSPQFLLDSVVAQVDDLPGYEWQADASAWPTGTLYARVIARSTTQPERFWQVSRSTIEIGGVSEPGAMPFTLP